jgi:hypothetical protein
MNPVAQSQARPTIRDVTFAGAAIEYPVSFDLRIIYSLAGGASIAEDLERIYVAQGVECRMLQGISAPGAKYGRMGSRVTFASREQMHRVYAEIATLPYVKMAL